MKPYTFTLRQKTYSIKHYIQFHYKKALFIAIQLLVVFGAAFAGIFIHQSTEFYMLRNWDVMQNFAEFHRNYKGEQANADFMKSLNQ